MSKYIFLILLAGIFAGCSSQSKLQNKQAGLYFSAGTQSLIDQDYTAALNSLLKANELNPENSEILTNLGMAYYFKDEKDLAIKYLKQALKINESNSDAKVNLASIYFKDGNYSAAEKLYKEVLKDLTYDKQARTYYNLGLIEAQVKKDLASAEDYFKRSIKEDENYCPSFFQLGMIQYQQRQYSTALKNFKEAGTATCYSAPAPFYYQGLTYMALGKYDEARLKFDDVETRFKKSVFAAKARAKTAELNNIEINQTKSQTHASKDMGIETSEF
jgi:type IV pilus assembly protein PilF